MEIEAPDHGGTSRTIEVSHPDKVFFPADGSRPELTKADVVRYYRRIAEVMVPHLRDRPLALHRFPDGIEADGFFQKQAPDHFPSWLRTAKLEKEGGTVEHVLGGDAASLVYLANQGCVTFHVWLARHDRPRHPDRLVFDLDPPDEGAELEDLRWAARQVRSALAERQLEARLMTTGSRGYHVVVPLDQHHDFETVRGLARDVAEKLAAEHDDRLTVEQRKSKRGGRIFVDWLRNGYAQLTVAPYSLRARPGAPVATPIRWDELAETEPGRHRHDTIFRRLGQTDDPWAEMAHGSGESLEAALERI